MSENSIEYQRELRGIPLWLLEEYLFELGASRQAGGGLSANGWSAYLEQLDDFQVGSLRVGQVRLRVQASAEAWQNLQPLLEKKLLRAGG